MPPVPRTPLQVFAALYVGIGLLVFFIIAFRGGKVRRPFNPNSPLWDAKDNSRNALFGFIQIFTFGSIGPVIAILFWPIWLLWLVYSTERVQKWLDDDKM
jgi:hypothetical protein